MQWHACRFRKSTLGGFDPLRGIEGVWSNQSNPHPWLREFNTLVRTICNADDIIIKFQVGISPKVRAVTSLRTFPHTSYLTRPHPHAVRRIIIRNRRLVPYWCEILSDLESAGLELRIRTILLQTHRLARGEHLTDWATKTEEVVTRERLHSA